MQASKGVFDRSRVIILYKMVLYPKLRELCFVIAFEEEPSLILEYRGLDQEYTWNGSINTFHRHA
jgi:hypothetical protein